MPKMWLKAVTLLLWSFALTALTVFLGAAPLKPLKDVCGRWGYWLLSMALVTGLAFTPWKALGALFLCLVVLVGVFSDLEERGHSLLYSGLSSLLVTCMLSTGGFIFWIYRFGVGWRSFLITQIETYLEPAKQLAGVTIDAETLLAQAPSGAVILLLLSLFMALLSEDRLRGLMALPRGFHHRLIWFRLPDVFAWLFIATLFLSFAKLTLLLRIPYVQTVALNILNVLIMLYFFQGLAVVVKTFEVFRVSIVWQYLFFILIVFQLFLFVSVLGLVDFWANFRSRLHRKADGLNKKEEI